MKSPPRGPRLKPFGLPQRRQKTWLGLSSGGGVPMNKLAVSGGEGVWWGDRAGGESC